MNKEDLLIVYGTDYKEMTKALLSRAMPEKDIPDRDTLIGIKPNLVSPVLPEDGATTHKEVCAALIEYLQEKGYYNLVVLESAWVGARTQEVVKLIGYDSMLEKYGVPFLDLQLEKKITKMDCGGMDLNIYDCVRGIGFLINVPVLKGHCQTRITCALKNLKGLIPGSEKRRFHRLGLHDPIGHLSAGIHQDFILVDSICGDLTFEEGGNPVTQNRVFAAKDPVLCDTFGCSLLGIDPADVPYIGTASGLGIGTCDLSQAKIEEYRFENGNMHKSGVGAAGLPSYKAVDIPAAGGFGHIMQLAEKVDEVDSCSACYAYLIPALEMLKKEGLLEYLSVKVAIGQGHRGQTGELGVGNCTRGFRHHLDGCPPTENQMYDFLREYIETRRIT